MLAHLGKVFKVNLEEILKIQNVNIFTVTGNSYGSFVSNILREKRNALRSSLWFMKRCIVTIETQY